MGLAIVAGAIATAFLNIDKIQRFKGAGFEAEMKRAVEEVYATVDSLREMSKPLIVSVLNSLIYSGRREGLGIQQKHQLKEELDHLINKLEIKDDKVNETLEEFYRQYTWDLFQLFITKFLRGRGHQSKLGEKLKTIYDRNSTMFPSKEEILQVLKVKEEDLTEMEKEALNNYLYYQEKRCLRQTS